MGTKLQLLFLTVAVAVASTFGDEDVDGVESMSRRSSNPDFDIYNWIRRLSDASGDFLEEQGRIPKRTASNGATYVVVYSGKSGEPSNERDLTYFGFSGDFSITIFKLGARSKCFGLRTNNDINGIRNILAARNGTVLPANAPSVNLYLDARGSAASGSFRESLFKKFPALQAYCGSVPIVMTPPLKTRPTKFRGAAIHSLRGKMTVVVG